MRLDVYSNSVSTHGNGEELDDFLSIVKPKNSADDPLDAEYDGDVVMPRMTSDPGG